MLSGIALVIGITLVAGGIAYIGDRVGHQVGRKRLTLFGLRPKYTSTIVAVATGMLIALSVTLVALIGSNLVRTAFFRLGQINARIAELEAQELAARNELKTTRDSRIVLPIGATIPNVEPVTIRPSASDAVLLPELSRLFEQTVTQLNRDFPPKQYPLKPYRKHAAEADIQAGLRRELGKIRDDVAAKDAPAGTPVLLVPVIGQNLFEGDTLSFAFSHYLDRRIAASGDVLASTDVQGGKAQSLQVLQRLTASASAEVLRRGMPPAYAQNVSINGPQVQAAFSQVARLHGRYRLTAKSTIDLYPHSGGVLLDFALAPEP